MSYAAAVKQLTKEAGELLARHERAKDIRVFTRYADDPAGFMGDVLRCQPWHKQTEMARRVRDNPRTLGVTANGLGKDWATARIALWWVYARGGFVILTGPTERQVKQILMREVRRAFALAPELPGELYSLELRVNEDSGILALTSDNADRLTGFHHPRLLICITEGQGVSEDAYEAAMACTTGPENRLFVYGNPTNPTGPFYRAALSDAWNVLTIRADEHPNVVTGRSEIPGAVSREWIEMMRDEYGETSSIYRSRVLAEFPEDAAESLIRREWLRAAFDRFESGELNGQMHGKPLMLALDVARFGPDKSVLSVVQGPVIREMITWGGASITETVDRTIEHAKRVSRPVELETWFPQEQPRVQLHCDEPGLGGGCIDMLRQKGWPTKAFNGAAQAMDSRRFENMRAEAYWSFRTLLENGRVAIPRDRELEEEAAAIEWTINTRGRIQILSKDLIRSTLGRSPDKLDSVVIALSQSVGGFLREWKNVQVAY